MKIVALDGFTLNPGDLSWEPIKNFGSLTVYDRTPLDEIAERCRGATIVLTNKAPLDGQILSRLPQLKFISVTATGYNIIDVITAKERNILVCNVPAYGTASVAQHTIALLLELTNNVGIHAQSVSSSDWSKSIDWCYSKKPITELDGKIIGLVGLGNIGKQTAEIAKAFGMKVLYNSITEKQTDLGIFVDMETLFAQSDVLSLHCPLTSANMHFVNKKLLHFMKPSSFLINTARGLLINEHDLSEALNTGRIAGAALDVLSSEPPQKDNPLLTAKNCIITPHNAWMSKEARQRIMDETVKNIQAFFNHQPVNLVN